MFHKILFVSFVLILVGLGIFMTRFSKTNDLMENFQHYGLIQSDIKYESVEKMWGEQGLIFYQVEFPFLNIPHHADKMTFAVNDVAMKLSLSNLSISVRDAMHKVHGDHLASELENYIPFNEFFNKILTSLSVMGIDEFVGDIFVNTTYSDFKTMSFTLQAHQENRPTLNMSGIIHVPVVGAHQLSDLWKGKLDSLEMNIQDENLLNRYINYVKSRQMKIPSELKKGYLKLKNIPNSLPKLNQILR